METVVEWLKTHTRSLTGSVHDRVEEVAGKCEDGMKTLVEEAAAPHGPGVTAGLAGARALVSGKNPLWPAVKGLVSRLSAKTKITTVLLVVLVLLLGPLLLVLLLLALIVAGLVAAVRSVAR
ncbi:MAG: hypothetical protein K0Q46_945 [Rhodococcus erythropolis]|jgi:hypothetical protein|nr:hypothetical protein [Rhodococcus erythropolis]MDF2894159.1 hypothetical protein [Rhodococcus erythropolis]